MKLLRSSFEEQTYLLDVDAHDIDTVLRLTLNDLCDKGYLERDDFERVLEELIARERVVSTAIGHAVGVPHAYSALIEKPVVAFVRLAHPLNLGAPDGIPTRFLFVLLGPPDATTAHLDTLTHIARLTSDDEFRYEIELARNGEHLVAALDHFLERSVPSPVPEGHEVAGLEFTGRFGGGLLADLRRRLPWFADDFAQGVHPKTFSATFFLYFACLAPAIAFGGLMGEKTGDAIGTVEMIVATAICGVTYVVLGGSPLIILGGTGPLLVLTAILYTLAGTVQSGMGEPPSADYFLAVYAWVGLWTALLLVILAVTDASALMRYFTRFTDEIFSALISVIFIYEAVHKLVEEFTHVGTDHGGDPYHATALLSIVLALGTFYVAMNLSRFRQSHYLRPWIREFLADFGPTIAIVLMTAAAIWFGNLSATWEDHIHLTKLQAPEAFGTTSGRPWFVDLNAVPTWVKFATLGPALLVTVLVYLDQNITARLVNSPDHKLHKGAAYHWDLLVVGVLVAGCSLVGIPWLVAATVRSLNHLRALATVEEVVGGGTKRERIIHTRETRMTGLLIHLLLGASLLALPLMREIPMAVLYGLFLYMGVVSMSGNQFFERLSLLPTDPDLYPRTHYVRRVPIRKVHLFTGIQLACLVVLWVVKVSPLGILFPLFIALLVPIRMALGRFYTPEQLAALDAHEEPEAEQTHWVA